MLLFLYFLGGGGLRCCFYVILFLGWGGGEGFCCIYIIFLRGRNAVVFILVFIFYGGRGIRSVVVFL